MIFLKNCFKVKAFILAGLFLLGLVFVIRPVNVFAQLIGDTCSVDSQCGSSDLFCFNDQCAVKSGESFSNYNECFSSLIGKVSSAKTVCCQTFTTDAECKSSISTSGTNGSGSGLTTTQILNGFNACVDTRYNDETEQQAIIRCCQDNDWSKAPICTTVVASPDLGSLKTCSPACATGFVCNTLNGVCVQDSSSTGSTGSSGSTGSQGAGSGSTGSSATCNQGSCPIGLCEANGLCLPKSNFNTGIAASDSLVDLLTKIIKFLLTFAGIIAVGVLVIGGFWYITSSGNEEQAEKGQKAITNAIIGLVVVILAYTIVAIISATLVADKFTK